MSPINKSPSISSRSILLGIIIVIAVIVGVGSGIYYYIQYQNAKTVLGNSTNSSQIEIKTLLQKAGKLIDLPTSEQPTIATVSDITKLKNQKFFAHAKNGDKVLIYQKTKKAILYDPKSNKIIEVETINIGESPTPSPTAIVSAFVEPVKTVLLNGTKTSGLASFTEKSLATGSAKNVRVIAKGDAKSNYAKTLVVDLTGKKASVAAQLARILKGEVGKLPSEEVKPVNADILVLLGNQP